MIDSENLYVRILVRLGHYNEAEALVKLHRLERQRTEWRDKKRRSNNTYGRNLWTTADQIVLDGIEAQIATIRQQLTDGPLLAPEPLQRSRDDYVLVVRVYLNYQPGYAHELRPDHPEDIAALQGSIDGELDGAEGEICVLWPNYSGGFVSYDQRSTVIESAGIVFRDLQQRQAHGRIVISFGDRDVMWLTEWILKAEWDAAEEFTGW